MNFEVRLLTGLLVGITLLLVGGAGGAALRSWMSTIQNSTEIENLKARVDKLESEC